MTPWCLKSPDIDCLLNSLSRLTTKKPSKVKLCWPFVKGIYWWPHHTHIGPVMRNACPWWRHQMETFSSLLAICAGNIPFSGEFPTQRPVTRSFNVFFDLRPNKRLSKQWWGWWFETLPRSLWRHCNAMSWRHDVFEVENSCVFHECCISGCLLIICWPNKLGAN